ncbi:catalase-related immune-responsive protein [Streptomyces sp. 846.5]|nr:catalase-related immune-responsive protein [Streptomyces sp. 846.5]
MSCLKSSPPSPAHPSPTTRTAPRPASAARTHAAQAHAKDDDFFQAGELYRLMSDGEKDRLIANLAGSIGSVGRDDVVERVLPFFHAADADYGRRLQAAVEAVRNADEA